MAPLQFEFNVLFFVHSDLHFQTMYILSQVLCVLLQLATPWLLVVAGCKGALFTLVFQLAHSITFSLVSLSLFLAFLQPQSLWEALFRILYWLIICAWLPLIWFELTVVRKIALIAVFEVTTQIRAVWASLRKSETITGLNDGKGADTPLFGSEMPMNWSVSLDSRGIFSLTSVAAQSEDLVLNQPKGSFRAPFMPTFADYERLARSYIPIKPREMVPNSSLPPASLVAQLSLSIRKIVHTPSCSSFHSIIPYSTRLGLRKPKSLPKIYFAPSASTFRPIDLPILQKAQQQQRKIPPNSHSQKQFKRSASISRPIRSPSIFSFQPIECKM